MPIYMCLQDLKVDAVDIIIVGGGTSGCIIAGRISQAKPNLSILVVEGGGDNRENLAVRHPIMCSTHLKGDGPAMSSYRSMSTEHVCRREHVVKTASILGGGSSVNFCIYTRPSAMDFDDFEEEGWAFQEVLPFMKRFEHFHGHGNSAVHGLNGPIQISDGGFRSHRVEEMALKCARETNHLEIFDAQDPTASPAIGVSSWQRYVSRDGVRQDTAHGYLQPLLENDDHPNLHVLLNTQCVRIVFDDNKHAIGIECSGSSVIAEKLASKLVVLAAGTFGSPQILKSSGIGSASLLKPLGIPIICDSSQVGENYQDHPLISASYKTSLLPGETLDRALRSEDALSRAMASQDSITGWNGVDPAEIISMSPAFQAAWSRDYENSPDRPMVMLALVSSFNGNRSLVPVGQYLSAVSWVAYPYSRGSIHITSALRDEPPKSNSGLLSDTEQLDLEMLVWAYRKGHEIISSLPVYEGPADIEGKASCGHPANVFLEVGSLTLDDSAIEQFVRETADSAYHSLGTCRLGSRLSSGVVDQQLKVHGVTGLRCADMSICPNNLCSNTASVAMTIGEKAASMILDDLSL
ncbi:alcohol oxidase-like protein [Leptodontidium sp. MPI-SDFR-AT-0119]|nr:alcohol oxidase-like protein [Leptodontidium sp. MPI-SDFR-AT-0119]